uniref:Orf136 n=1 Tax=Acavomonas peruviana TaxID=1542312 RepID=V5KVH7_9ALVE|nr:orf136 [Acavomonas peruviana]
MLKSFLIFKNCYSRANYNNVNCYKIVNNKNNIIFCNLFQKYNFIKSYKVFFNSIIIYIDPTNNFFIKSYSKLNRIIFYKDIIYKKKYMDFDIFFMFDKKKSVFIIDFYKNIKNDICLYSSSSWLVLAVASTNNTKI